MTITASELRANFPEFANRGNYPDAQVNFWITVSYMFLNKRRWGEAIDLGAQLFVAHNLVLEKQAGDAARFGGAPGTGVGVLNSKAVDKVSAGYDAALAAVEGGGNWNATTYGTRFLYYTDLMGTGPIQDTGCDSISGSVVWGGQNGPGTFFGT